MKDDVAGASSDTAELPYDGMADVIYDMFE
jgi:hypothetical protein